MFTGIIETTGEIIDHSIRGTNKTFVIRSEISKLLKPDQSVSHNGICLTVELVNDNTHTVTTVQETALKTNSGKWKEGEILNLERCLQINSRLDGHFVQGHVDTTAECLLASDLDGSYEFRFQIHESFSELVIEKGSISINGISLTIYNLTKNEFSVSIIPYTYQHTNMSGVRKGTIVNIEFDMIGKYINRKMSLNQSGTD